MAGVAQQMTDGTFDFVAKPRRKSQAMLIKKLAHGRVSRTKDGDVQLWLKVGTDENINISQAIAEEAQAAAEAIQQYQLRNERTSYNHGEGPQGGPPHCEPTGIPEAAQHIGTTGQPANGKARQQGSQDATGADELLVPAQRRRHTQGSGHALQHGGHGRRFRSRIAPLRTPHGRGATDHPGKERRARTAHARRSVTKGYHLVFRRRKELSNEANLQWASDLLGVAFGKGAKDLTRVFFTTSASPSDLLFLHDDLFAMGACENVERAAHDTPTPTAKASEGASGEVTQPQARTYKGVPYSQIIHRWFALTGGEPTLGERNVRLYQLAAALRAICDNDPQLLLAVVPSYGLPNEEMHAILQSACKEQPKGLSKTLRAAIEQAKRATLEPDEADEQSTTQPTRQRAPEAFAMSRMPPALRASLKGVPENMWWPVIAAVMPIAAAYADGVTVEYCDGARQRLALMSIILGDQASGKSVCKKAVDLWKRQLDREDQEARQREDEWKAKRKSRKANEKAPDDPQVLIRVLPVTVSCSTLLKRFKTRGDTPSTRSERSSTRCARPTGRGRGRRNTTSTDWPSTMASGDRTTTPTRRRAAW